MPPDDRAIAISATFTAEAIQPALSFWAGELGLDLPIRFAGYSQVFQELLDPAGLFAGNRAGYNILLVRFEDWKDTMQPEEAARRLADAVRTCGASSPAPLIVALCPPTPPHAARFAASAGIVREGLASLPPVHLLFPDDVLGLYPVETVHDPHGDELGHLPYTPEFFAALATAIARRIHGIRTPPFKVAALDCDETLWAGICGEDGPQGVVIDPPRRALQEFLLEQRRKGLLLALASKNNEDDVIETFRAHLEMPLRLEDFAARRINWESKSANLAALAEELDLGLDSFLLVDDDPRECTEAQAGAPELVALPLPADPAQIPAFLRHLWAFDRARVTEEDRRRPELYAQRAERTRAEKSAANLEEFLASLRLEIDIAPMRPEQAARIAQLTRRTNQMNATGVRRSEAEVLALNGAECLAVEVKDRFGSYGLTGAMIFRQSAGSLSVDTFLLSCRALGRGVEHRMVARLGEIASERALALIEIPFVPAKRNQPARLFLESLRALDPDGVFRLPAAEAASVVYRVGRKNESRPPAPAETSHAQPAAARRVDYLRIASDLRTPAAILAQIRAASLRHAPAPSDPPRTPLERDLATLWAELLHLTSVGVHENFFELGGHSLLAVQLLSRVRHIYGVELSLEVVYSGDFTVAELAKAVELKEIEQAGGDYQDLLRELEALSDDEVRALLAEEQDAS